MNSINELKWNELNHSYQPSDFSFRATDEVESISGLLNQEDAIDAIKLGLQINSKGYNLYICGVKNNQIEETIIEEIKKVAKRKEKPMAMGYIYNFNIPEEPIAVALKSEDAIQLKEDLQEFQMFILTDIPMLLEGEDVQDKQKALIEEFEKLSEKYLLDLAQKAEQYNVHLKQTEEGIRFAPCNAQGEYLSKEAFLKLSTTEQEEIMEKISVLQEYADEMMEILESKENDYIKLYSEIGQELVLREIGKNIKNLQERYKAYSAIQCFLNGVAEEVLENLELLASDMESVDLRGEQSKESSLALLRQEIEHMVKKYDINLLNVPNEDYAPVINDRDYMELGLNGNILLDVEGSTVQSNFLNIRPGLLNKANGGYLIVHLDELVEKKSGWQQLKKLIKTGKMYIEGNEELGISLNKRLKPQPVLVEVKIILIGNYETYELLKNYDEEFLKLFKMRIAFDEEIDISPDKIKQIAGAIKEMSKQEGILPVTTEGLLSIIEYGCRKMDHPAKISSDLEWIMDLLREAQCHTQEKIEKKDIEKCIEKREQYERKVKERLDESLQDGTYLIDTKGAKVGQINGLAVYSIGELSFGRPIRITATTYRGKRGIVDIEDEAKLSGSIHTKGVHIITGFLGNQFAQEIPLSLNCNLCFEQSYVGVDGDSASSAELYAILSSLADVPICQNIAVTGSVNQFGEIQPVGGINEKIEGFFQVCKKRGLNGNEGVMIPRTNMKDLLLTKEIIEAAKSHKFHIYAITDIWEGVEIMMAEKREVVKSRIMEKLIKFNQ